MSARLAAETIADFCATLSWRDLDTSARTRTTELVLDHIGVALAGSKSGSSRSVRRFLRRVSRGGYAGVLGTTIQAEAPWAALANAAAAHATELDDCTRESSLHPGVSVIPAALAMAEDLDAPPQALLEAVACGYEVTMRVGSALNPASTYKRGFHPTGVAGVFGAAAAAGRLLDLNAARLARALGIAGTMAAGSLEYLTDGSWTKRLNPGWAAHAGIVAAQLAAEGFTGPASVFDGPLSVLHAYTDAPAPERLLADLGAAPLMVTRVSIKPYAGCRYSHGIIDCVLEVRRNANVDPGLIVGIDLGLLSIGEQLVADPIEKKRNPRNVVEAQFSAPFAAAVALMRGRASLAEFTQGNLRDPVIRRLMSCTSYHTDRSLDALFPERLPSTVSIELSSGRTIQTRVDYPLGEPENPLGPVDLTNRFAGFAAGTVGGSDVAVDLAQRILRLDQEGSVRDVMSRLQPTHDSRGSR